MLEEAFGHHGLLEVRNCYFRRSLKSYFLTPINGTSVSSPFLKVMGRWHVACGVWVPPGPVVVPVLRCCWDVSGLVFSWRMVVTVDDVSGLPRGFGISNLK